YGTYGKRVANTLSQLNDVIHKDDISPNYTTTTTANTTHKLEGENTSKKMSMNVFNSPVVVKSIHENQLNDSFNTMDSLMNRPIGIATVTTASQQTPPPPPTTTTSPFGFPIFQPICDASGDVDYRVLLNPALRNLTNNDTMNINNR
ncbi:unnamed protein product, partial [Trichobilharzia regenti]